MFEEISTSPDAKLSESTLLEVAINTSAEHYYYQIANTITTTNCRLAQDLVYR